MNAFALQLAAPFDINYKSEIIIDAQMSDIIRRLSSNKAKPAPRSPETKSGGPQVRPPLRALSRSAMGSSYSKMNEQNPRGDESNALVFAC